MAAMVLGGCLVTEMYHRLPEPKQLEVKGINSELSSTQVFACACPRS